MPSLFYLAWWQLRAWCGRQAPLQSVIFILDKCNLRCKHCSVYAISTPRIKTLAQIKEELEYCYAQGSRFVDFEGGELYLWRDNSNPERPYNINDVVDLAHEIGFWNVTITTNAQLSFVGTHADQVWVSMDGIKEWHDNIRGAGTFERLERNIALYAEEMDDGRCKMEDVRCKMEDGRGMKEDGRCKKRKAPVCVNMVINNENCDSIDATMEYVKANPNIDKISVNFHTPFSETEQLFLDPDKRNEIIDKLLDYKRRGYPIMNSRSGLKAMKMKDGKTLCTDKYCWITNFIFSDGSRAPKCMGYTHGVCDRCGFSMGGEMSAVGRMKIDTLISGMKLRMKK